MRDLFENPVGAAFRLPSVAGRCVDALGAPDAPAGLSTRAKRLPHLSAQRRAGKFEQRHDHLCAAVGTCRGQAGHALEVERSHTWNERACHLMIITIDCCRFLVHRCGYGCLRYVCYSSDMFLVCMYSCSAESLCHQKAINL